MEILGEELAPGLKCIKYLMVAFNSIFVLTGILIIVAGTTIHAIYYTFDQLLESTFFSPATLLIVVGSVIFFVALFGCVGAARESTCLINVFALLLGTIFVLEISSAIAAFAMQSSVRESLHDNMLCAIQNNYMKDPEVNATIDMIQEGLTCCGVDGPLDWQNVTADWARSIHLNPDTDILLPNSCCAEYNINNDCTASATEGCLSKLTFIIRQSATLLAAAALTVSMIQIVGVYFAFSLAKAMREAKNARTRRQYEIQQQLINSYSLNPKENPTSAIFIGNKLTTEPHS